MSASAENGHRSSKSGLNFCGCASGVDMANPNALNQGISGRFRPADGRNTWISLAARKGHIAVKVYCPAPSARASARHSNFTPPNWGRLQTEKPVPEATIVTWKYRHEYAESFENAGACSSCGFLSRLRTSRKCSDKHSAQSQDCRARCMGGWLQFVGATISWPPIESISRPARWRPI